MTTSDNEIEYACFCSPKKIRKSYDSLKNHLYNFHKDEEVSLKFLKKYDLKQCKDCGSFRKKNPKILRVDCCQNCKLIKNHPNILETKLDASNETNNCDPFEFESNLSQSLYYLDDFNFQKVPFFHKPF